GARGTAADRVRARDSGGGAGRGRGRGARSARQHGARRDGGRPGEPRDAVGGAPPGEPRPGSPAGEPTLAAGGRGRVRAAREAGRLYRGDPLAALYADAAELLLRLGGTPSGEHGVGRLRAGLLERFYGPEVMALFRELRRAYDSRSLLNPGVIIPSADWAPLADLKLGP